MESYPKFQYSQFDSLEGQYVVRTDDQAEFKELVKLVKLATGNVFAPKKAPVTQNSASTSEKPKIPYMWAGDICFVCQKGILSKTVKVSKTGEKYNALICDQQNCKGFAYVSKYPKRQETYEEIDNITIENNDRDIPF